MNKVKCTNNHWFDLDRYSVCPHCGAKKLEENVTEAKSDFGEGKEKNKKKGLFGRLSKTNREQSIGSVNDELRIITGRHTENSVREDTLIQSPNGNALNNQNVSDETKIQSLNNSASISRGSEVGNVENKNTSEQEKFPVYESLDVKTVTKYANAQGEEPVSGWLVCIDGVYKGKAFNLKAGVNVIGRDERAYVCLKKDQQVSREKHASIIYEPKKKVCYGVLPVSNIKDIA